LLTYATASPDELQHRIGGVVVNGLQALKVKNSLPQSENWLKMLVSAYALP
jgi:hypothetical protein